jgi:hypothetical protein
VTPKTLAHDFWMHVVTVKSVRQRRDQKAVQHEQAHKSLIYTCGASSGCAPAFGAKAFASEEAMHTSTGVLAPELPRGDSAQLGLHPIPGPNRLSVLNHHKTGLTPGLTRTAMHATGQGN